jgi:hypothetical protein
MICEGEGSCRSSGSGRRSEGKDAKKPRNLIKTLEFDADFADRLKNPPEGLLFFGMLFA